MHLPQLAVLSLLSTASAASLPLRIVSFNIRWATPVTDIGEKPWWSLFCGIWPSQCREPHTTAYIADIVASAPSTDAITILGLQEVVDNQLIDIKNVLGASRWKHIGVARDDGKKSGEYSPIIYNADALDVLYSETKWLSPTPDSVSFGWGAGSRRVVTIGVFQHKVSGKRFIHGNTHLDNVSQQARMEGIKVVAGRLRAVQRQWGLDLGVTLTGDFNSSPGSGDAYGTLRDMGYLQDLWDAAPHVGPNELTYTGWTREGKSRIDYVWFGPVQGAHYSAIKVEVRDNVRSDILVSDHRPVVGDLTLL
ncbi:endonuclease/Exonuclease/phosphatase [Microdochium bolleyi]|uniref:Endonuclease/Exonuclease/phosphatase n=1 Tax=Microdochium bolleyi TaxID=196109 RepID=A0A136ISM5_9PEZI|nr:endonuclease/Exonuclease/phosphatase [Microdochium bolleyi]